MIPDYPQIVRVFLLGMQYQGMWQQQGIGVSQQLHGKGCGVFLWLVLASVGTGSSNTEYLGP